MAAPAAPVITISAESEYRDLTRRADKLGFSTVAQLIEAMEKLDASSQQDPIMTTPNSASPSPATVEIPSIPSAIPAAPMAAPTGSWPAAVMPTPAASAAPPVTPAGVPPDEHPEERRLPDHVRARIKKARDDMRTKTALAEQQAAQFQQQATTYQQQIAVMQAEESMKIDLVRSGVKELDFVWFDMKKHIAALTADKTPEGVARLRAFDVSSWAAEQRKTRPFLFGEQPVPANTGAPIGTPPAPASPGTPAVAGAAAGAGQFDARSADAQSYRKRMAELGIEVGGYMAPPRRN